MPSQRVLAGLVAVLAAALVLLSVLFLSRERERAAPLASLPPARPIIAAAEPPSAEPLLMVSDEEDEDQAPTSRIELPPFDADHPGTVVAPPLSDPARTWEDERDARRELASRSIALLLRDGTTPTTSIPGRAASGTGPASGGGGRVLIARAPPTPESPRAPGPSFAPSGSGWVPGRSRIGPGPVPRRAGPARRSGGGAGRCSCP